MKDILYVAGSFDSDGGRSSKLAEQIFEAIGKKEAEYHNGGSFEDLEHAIDHIDDYKLIFWSANVPNDKPKPLKVKSIVLLLR